jgi:DNA repair protein RadD
MIYTLREYQQQASDAGLRYFQDPRQTKPVLMVISTGAGKSLVISDIAKRLNEPLCVFSPTKEILEQNYQKMLDFGILGVTIYSASCNKKEIGNITLATIGSVYRKPNDFKVFKHFIVDECDVINPKASMYKTFIDAVGGKYIGLSATPYRMSVDGFGGVMMKFLTRTNPRVFHRVIHVTQTKYLSDLGYLAKTEYFQVDGFRRTEIRLNSTQADYLESSEKEYYSKSDFSKRIIKVVNRLLDIGKTRILVFTKFVDEARELAERLGERAAIVHCEMKPKERERIIKGFKSGEIQVVLNVGILTIGFDYPELEVVVMARPTRSLRLYYQTIGRVLRPHPSKEKAMIVDLCGNFEVFGKVEDMELREYNDNIWYVESKGRRLTNVYLSEIRNL